MIKLEQVSTTFKLPILYNRNRQQLTDAVMDDLELIKTNDPDNVSIYHKTINPQSVWGDALLSEWSKHYTTDVKFLKDSQTILCNLQDYTQTLGEDTIGEFSDKIWNTWSTIKNDRSFKNNSGYIDFYGCEWINESELFLLCLSLYNMSSPIFAILLPFCILLMPFFFLQISGTAITLESYLVVLKDVSEGNALGRLIFNFHDSKMEDRVYMCISAGFYLFSFYQNFLFCVKFCNNLFVINTDLMNIRDHLSICSKNMESLSKLIDDNKLTTYHSFDEDMMKRRDTIQQILTLLNSIKPFKYKYQNIMELGTVMKTYYVIFQKEEYISTLLYSFGFQGYINILSGIQHQIQSKRLNAAKFKTKKQHTVMKGAYYAGLIDTKDEIVTNEFKFKQNMVLTGPNASGKTTILKASLINIIFSQQFGYGCYKQCILKPYDVIHCYINISDSLGRDSLFQTESKKCRAILESLKADPKKRHFCAFDELFSGTNPNEAVKCGHAYLDYLNKQKHRVDFLLTTHYTELCNKFDKNSKVQLCKMGVNVNKETGDYRYEYLLKKGINEIDGGVQVLKQLNFPEEIIKFVSF